MHNFILWALVIGIIGSALAAIFIMKRRGVKCIGCVHGGKCSSQEETAAGCGCSSVVTIAPQPTNQCVCGVPVPHSDLSQDSCSHCAKGSTQDKL